MSSRKNKGLGASWASKNVQRVEEAATSRMTDIQNAQRALEEERKALEQARSQHVPLQLVSLDQVLTHGDTQPRVQMDDTTWHDYAERMTWRADDQKVVDPEGQVWPGLHLIQDGDKLWLADGFHRLQAAQHAGLTRFQALIEPGSQRDAIERSLGANARHGKRRTNADKRRAVERALCDQQWVQWTDARVARLCHVTSSLVGKVRSNLESDGKIEFESILHGEDGREFERQPPKRAASNVRATKSTGESSAKTHKPSHVSKHAVSRLKRFSDLARSKKKVDVLVAHPSSAQDWERLQNAASVRVSEGGCLVVPTMSGSRWLWQGPQLLDVLTQDDGFAQPQLVYIERFSRQFLVWRRAEGELERVDSPIQLSVHPPESILVVGMALDDWNT